MPITRVVGKNADFHLILPAASTNANDLVTAFDGVWGGAGANTFTNASIGYQDLSPIGNNITLNMEVSNEEGTGYGADWKEFDLIHGNHSIDATFFMTVTSGTSPTFPDIENNLMKAMFWGAGGGPLKLGYRFGPNGLPSAAATSAPSYRGVIIPTVNISAPVAGIITISLRGQGDGTLYRRTA